MQIVVLCKDFEIGERINALLKEGWSVVPGTTSIASLADGSKLPQVMISVVLQKTENTKVYWDELNIPGEGLQYVYHFSKSDSA